MNCILRTFRYLTPTFWHSIGLALLLSVAISNNTSAQFLETFDNVTDLPSKGWTQQNLSTTIGSSPNWFQGQGNPVLFDSHQGPANAYIASNFNAIASPGTISNWLVLPTMALNNGDQISFWTRTVNPVQFPDRLQLRMSSNGASANVGSNATDVGDFSALLVEVNPGLTPTGYPVDWTQFSATVSGLAAPTSGRFAFRHFVTDAGLNNTNGDVVGIDTVSIIQAVPEPTGLAVLVAGSIALISRRRRSPFAR